MDDEELIRRARQGDMDAFQALFDRYAVRLEGEFRRRIPDGLRSKISIQDVQQEARLVALRRLPDFEDRGPGSFGAWVSRILDLKLREAIHRDRDVAKRAAGREISREGRGADIPLAACTPTPSQWAMAGELQEAADRAFERLSEEDREVIRLVRHEQLPLAEVAARLVRTLDATKKLSAKAIARFAKLLREEQGK